MNQSASQYLLALNSVHWQKPEEFSFPTVNTKQWLLEKGSLSHLLACCCDEFNVELISNDFIQEGDLNDDEINLLSEEICLLRKVILTGDGQPWIFGRTLIPQSSLQNQQYDLIKQGNTPLGVTVFSLDDTHRDALEIGVATLDGQYLFARRSRLWMNHKPMLVAELFLPESPIYNKE